MNSLIKYFCLFSFLCTAYLSSAQPYTSIFGDSSTVWNIAYEIPDAIDTETVTATHDSTVNGINYKAIERTHYSSDNGLLREDTTSGKVWFKPYDDTLEYLIMDLSLATGDTFWLNIPSWEHNNFCLIDSVYYKNSKKHVRTNYILKEDDDFEGSGKLIFIEGVGPSAGVLFNYPDDNLDITYLLCAYKDTVQTYSNTLYDGECYVSETYYWDGVIGIEEEDKQSGINIYPNPNSGIFNLGFKEEFIGQIIITDLIGRVVFRKNNLHIIGTKEVSIQAFIPGIYFLKPIEGKTGNSYTQKIMVNP